MHGRDDLGDVRADQRGAQNLVRVRIHDGLPEAIARVAQRLGARDRGRGDLRDQDVQAGLAGLALGQADTRQLGGGEHRVGDRAAPRGGRRILQGRARQLRADNAEVRPGRVCEHGGARAVAGRPHALRRRAQVLIHRDETAIGQLNPGLVQADAIRVGHATRGHQDRLGGHRRAVGQRQRRRVALARGRLGTAAHNPHAGGREASLDDAGGVLVLARQHVIARRDERDVHAERRHHRRELDADVAGADDRQGRGEFLQAQDLLVRPRARLPQAGNRGTRRTRPQVDEDALAADRALAAVLKNDSHRALACEAGLAADEVQARGREHLLVRAHHGADDALLVGTELGQVHARALGTDDAERLVRARIAQATSRVNQGLRGDAGHVNAGAADEATLHHGDLPAGLRALHRQGLAGLAAANDQQVDGLNCVRGHGSPSGCEVILPQRSPGRSIP